MALDTLAEPAAEPAPRTPRGLGRLDRRTLLLCAGIALVVAVLSGAIAAAVVGHDGTTSTNDLASARTVPTSVAFTRFDGTKGTLGDYAGQKLVVNFFASTCVPCRTEMPNLERVQKQAGDEVTVVGIAVEDRTAAARALVQRTGVHYDIGQDPTGALFADVGGTVLPYTIFVAADGTIMDRHSGALSLGQLHDKISTNLLAGG